MKYDIIVIGAGSGGLNIAGFANAINLKTLLIEKHKMGGDCLNYGCVPSKALIAIAKALHEARKVETFGLKFTGIVDMNAVADIIDARQEIIRAHENPDYFRDKGIDVEIGSPRFVGSDAIVINDKLCSARRIVIATGSRPALPPIKGLDSIDYLTNETLFINRELPGKLLVIGAGPIGIEIAQAYQRLGSQVNVVDLADRILPKEDLDISKTLQTLLEKEGVTFQLAVKPIQFTDKHHLEIQSLQKDNSPIETITFDRVLIATGRIMNTESLDLEKASIATENNRILLDKYLRTSNKRVYCCGDVTGDFLFTHWAEYQAAVVIRNMLSPLKTKVNPNHIAWVTYTDPEIASFGLSPEKLNDQGNQFKTISVPLKEVDRAICEGLTDGILKIHLSKGKILGGTLMAPHAGESVGELISFMTLKVPFTKLYQRIYPYPTWARIQRKGVQKYLGEKLTPRNTRILNRIFKFFNR
jgi:pyruvate/2-oxoglutarate dehydrogenase complex dihydrolipoamide dehydrogenase (E3) component